MAKKLKAKKELAKKISEYPGWQKNLVSQLSEERKEALAEALVANVQGDEQTRVDWLKVHQEILKEFGMQREPKSLPWSGCSNIGEPLMTRSIIQFSARAFAQLLPPKNLVKGEILGKTPDLQAISDRTTAYTNYYLDYKMEDYRGLHDTSLYKLALEGTLIHKTYMCPWDKILKCKIVQLENFIVPWDTRNLCDAPRYCEKVYYTKNEIQQYVNQGIFAAPDWDILRTRQKDLTPIDLQQAKNQGLTTSSAEVQIPGTENARELLNSYETYEIYTWADLDGDGIDEPIMAIVEPTSKTLLYVAMRADKDGNIQDMYESTCYIPNPNGFWGIGIGHLTLAYTKGMSSIMNQLIDAGTLANLATGFVNESLQTKRGAIAVTPGVLKNVKLPPGSKINDYITQFRFGEPSQSLLQFYQVLGTNADRTTTVTEIQTGSLPSSDTAATAVAAAVEQSQKVFSSVTRRYHIFLQKQFSKIYGFLGQLINSPMYSEEYLNEYVAITQDMEAIQKEAELRTQQQIEGIKQQYVLAQQSGVNTVALPPIPDSKSLYAQNYAALMEEIKVGLKDDFKVDIAIKPVSDPNITSLQEQAAKAQLVYQTVLSNPLTAQNPQAIYEATKIYLKSVEIPDYEINKVLVPPPPPSPPPNYSQEEENQIYLKGGSAQVLPEQNHQQHLAVLQEFEESPYAQNLSPEGKKGIEQHKRDHLAELYGQQVAQQRTMDAQLAAQILEGGGV